MSLPFAIAVFYTIWWVVLFAVLPFGARSHAESGVEHQIGTEAGAPITTRLGMKLLVTTGVAAVVFAALYTFVVFES